MRLLVLIACLLLPSLSWAYGFQTVTCSCGSEFAEQGVQVDVNLNNTGGMNIFYLSTNQEQVVENLYASCLKVITLDATADVNGDVPVFVSANYNNAFSLTCGDCVPAGGDYSKEISFILGGVAALGFALATTLKW